MNGWALLCMVWLGCLPVMSARPIAIDPAPKVCAFQQSGHLEDMDYRPESDRPVDEDKSSSHRIELIVGMAFIGCLLLFALFRQQARLGRRRMR